MKKILKLMAIPVAILALASCSGGVAGTSTNVPHNTPSSSQGGAVVGSSSTQTLEDSTDYRVNGVVKDFVTDFTQYENTSSYVKVSTAKEFLDALENAKTQYTNVFKSITTNDGYIVRNNVRKNQSNWVSAITKGLYLKNDDGTYTKIPSDTPWVDGDTTYTASMTYYEDSPYSTVEYEQTLTKASTVHVIEITADLDLGYNKIKDLGAANTFENWDKNKRLEGATDVYADPDMKEAGISKIKVENTTDLLIYSKNGSKLTHCGFGVSSCKNVVFRNLNMDEIWMWEDSTSTSPTIKVGDYDSFGWAYFKVSFSEGIWIDHCTFGKSFDGQIDYSNPVYNTMGTYSKAPYKATGSNGLHISFCDFKSGSDDKNGYLYKMMDRIEKEYQAYESDPDGYEYTKASCRYYFAIRDAGLTFDEILHGIAIPQKKAFLWGDSGDSYKYNKYLQVSMNACTIKDIEDRLPKVRGGMAYVYNTSVDNTEYHSYLSLLNSVQSAVQRANSKYKLANVSQGILAGLDASVYLESVVYKGINSYLKNNDSTNSNYPTVNGGYMIKNSIIGSKQGSSNDNNPFDSINSSKSSLTTANFAFKVNGEKTNLTSSPFTINCYDVIGNSSLDGYFETKPTGVVTTFSEDFWLTSK